jgi:hypothetical protein
MHKPPIGGFAAGIDFAEVLSVLAKQIYETPLAFLRENVQNAVDAIRIAALRRGVPSSDPALSVRIQVSGNVVEIIDNGIGMSLEELERLFWTIGASGKRTPEAREAGCVGMFGIGGFANFGVCDELSVLSKKEGAESGYWSRLSRADIQEATPGLPMVASGPTEDLTHAGTIVRGQLQKAANIEELRGYLTEFVRHAAEHVYFQDELVSRSANAGAFTRADLQAIEMPSGEFINGSVRVEAQFYEDSSGTVFATLDSLRIGNEDVRLDGWVRFEGAGVDVLKRGFKICTTSVPAQVGLTGVIDCDRLAPTAGRDSLNADSLALVSSIGAALERGAVHAILSDTERIAQHTRIFRYVRSAGLIEQMGLVEVALADGGATLLGELRRRAEQGVSVFFAATHHKNLAVVLHARGHTVVQLPSDRHKQIAVRDYLRGFCAAKALEGRVECSLIYDDLTRFEKAFLSELEETILSAYDSSSVKLVAARLTEDVPVFVPDVPKNGPLLVWADVRHPEISKLEVLGITPLFSSMVAAFCREYLASTLKGHSPKFFGSGAVNLDWLSKRRSELWVLMTDDIHTVRRGSQKQVVRSSDVHVVAAGQQEATGSDGDRSGRQPKIVKIDGVDEFADIAGHYLRIPNAATDAFGDVILEAEYRGAVWVGNKVTLVASDAISTAFQFEIRLDRLIVQEESGTNLVNAGASELGKPIHALFGGLYFPIPPALEEYLVPMPDREIRIEVRTEWVDFGSSRVWQPRDVGVSEEGNAH